MRITQILFKKVQEKFKPKPGEFKYWERYVQRQMRKAMGVHVYNRLSGPRTIGPRKFHFTEQRPWTSKAQAENAPNYVRPRVLVEPVKKQQFYKGDIVRDYRTSSPGNERRSLT